jgi:hypothetical protein
LLELLSLSEIARIYGVIRQAARQWADVITTREQRREYKRQAIAEKAKRIDAMLDSGMPLKAVASELGITYNWLWNFCADHGIQIKRGTK